ncbi:CHAT domain-containing protein [Edaphobacter aggregans]|uniref:CHAT domain-containing protein n=1 Tax=Edaphobacter aggregans TaxID=570835 RepID=A0A428MNA6_9BACT|nr:CHAT domain-containing protein [Edaphobacter aggregans]RSL18360.1 CHAT domain-containing protein [Edaphobacter aggregans]
MSTIAILNPEQSAWLLREAISRFEEGDDSEAVLLFHQALEAHSELSDRAGPYLDLIARRSDELLFLYGEKLWNAANYKAACTCFNKVAALNGSRREAALKYLNRVECVPIVPEFRSPTSGEVSGSVHILDSVLETRPEDLIRRTPHMDADCPWPAEAGMSFLVRIYADQSGARPGEESSDVEIRARGDVTEFPVDVELLATEHFRIEGSSTTQIIIYRGRPMSNSAAFTVTVVSPDADSKPGLTALFSYRGRPSGKVTRDFHTYAADVKPRRTVLDFDIIARPSGLTVTIVAQPANDGRQYWCTVRTPSLLEYAAGVTEAWNLSKTSREFVGDCMIDFTDQTTKQQLIATLKGAGRALFKGSPAIFQKIFWALIDAGKPPRSIAIVSEEPFIPWELMLPHRQLGGMLQKREPLGVEFRIGRWISEALAARQAVPITGSYVIAPIYQGPRALPFAQDESRLVVEKFAGSAIIPADFDHIKAAFEAGGRTLVHFACHGVDDPIDQAIYLDGDAKLSAKTFDGLDAADTAFQSAHPLVFLNACEAGRLKPALSGVGGFAASFIEKGASAVIAPLWSVKDTLAHEIATGFYENIAIKPWAEIMREFRAKAYDPSFAEDTYAAYCFYGDPDAALVVPKGFIATVEQ